MIYHRVGPTPYGTNTTRELIVYRYSQRGGTFADTVETNVYSGHSGQLYPNVQVMNFCPFKTALPDASGSSCLETALQIVLGTLASLCHYR